MLSGYDGTARCQPRRTGTSRISGGGAVLQIFEADITIHLTIRGVINKRWDAKTYAYRMFDPAGRPTTTIYDIDAGAFVSCECGLNFYSVGASGIWNEETQQWEGGFSASEVYRGTTLTDFEWGMCCGDNHLLVGKGKHGWEPVINLTLPLEDSTCTLDDGTICTVAEIRRDVLWTNAWDDILDLLVLLVERFQNGEITYEELLAAYASLEENGEIVTAPYIHSWKFTDPEGNERVFLNSEYIPFKYEKCEDYTVYAVTRAHVDDGSEDFVEDDTLYNVKCWANQYGMVDETFTMHNDGAGNNSRDVAFLTFGRMGAHPERVIRQHTDPLTGDVTRDTVALEVKDNHNFYSGH